MIRIAMTPAAYEAIAATLPIGAVAVQPKVAACAPRAGRREQQRRHLAGGERRCVTVRSLIV